MSRKKRFIPLLPLLGLVLLLAGCNSKGNFSTNLPTDSLPEHWSYTDAGLSFDGGGRDGFYLSSKTISNQDFQYATDVTFADQGLGEAALVFQSTDDHRSCYVASVSARANQAELYKIERGRKISLGASIAVADKAGYHLQVNMIDSHIAFFVDGVLICSTGDYVVSPDLGQDDVLLSGQLGLYSDEGALDYQNTYCTTYEAGQAPVLTALSVKAQSGSVEAEGNLLANGWYVYQQYVSADCQAVDILAETADGVDAVILSSDTGAAVTGSAALNPGQNHFQIYTTAKDANGESSYQLSYRLNILRRGDEEYYTEPYRGLYHYSVKEGWANDPNGLVKLGDTWHMFYQFYPEGTDWGAMHWAHATSTDLIHWEEKGIALYPNEYGTMFSGCAVVDEDNVSGLFGANGGIIAYITANGNGQRIIAAYSEDGDNWTYYRGTDEKGNPNGDDVLLDWTADPVLSQAFRDPKVFKYEDTWFMVIAGGKLRIYSSTDLLHWELESAYNKANDNSSGLTVETECPDLYRLPIEGESGWKWVLSYGGRSYQVGDFTRVDGKWEFIADADCPQPMPMNFGNDSYAAMTYYISPSFNAGTQDRVVSYSWMNSWAYCTVVDDFSGNSRFNGTFNLNLELSLTRDKDGRLVLKQTPIAEYGQYVFPAANAALDTSVTAAAGETAALDFQGDSYLMDVTITPAAGTTKAGVLVRSGGESYVSVDYDFTTDTLSFNRGMSGSIFSSSAIFSQAVTEARPDGSVTLHIYVDKSSLEVFSGGYTVTGAALLYPAEADTGAAVFSEGGGSSFHVTITTASSIWG